jgi:hypothetical protein
MFASTREPHLFFECPLGYLAVATTLWTRTSETLGDLRVSRRRNVSSRIKQVRDIKGPILTVLWPVVLPKLFQPSQNIIEKVVVLSQIQPEHAVGMFAMNGLHQER